MKISIRTGSIFAIILFGGFLCCGNPQGKGSPTPTEYIQMKNARKELKRNRKEWVESMHRAEPGINWRVIDRETRRAKAERRLAEKPSTRTAVATGSTESYSETVADGLLHGTWTERGSANLSGRMHTADVDHERGLIYNGSSGGNIWRANLDGTGWTCLNNSVKINDIKMVRLVPHESGKRLIVAGSWPATVYYTDDEGLSWHTATGLDDIESWGWFRRGVVANDSTRTIYLLGVEWDYVHWHAVTAIYKSSDHGESFAKIYSVNSDGHLFDIWTPRYAFADIYLLSGSSIYTVDSAGSLDSISSFDVIGGLGDVSDVVLAGCKNDSGIYLYALFAKSGNSKVYGSINGGETWNYRGELPETPFLGTHNNFVCSNRNPFVLYFGAVQGYRSYDGGVRWTMLNNWWEYYDRPETKLHADIPGIDVFLDGAGGEFALISTDGGLYISRDSLLTVQNLSLSDLAVSQYYSTYTCRFNPDVIYAGSQDQGFQRCQTDSGGMLDFVQLISGDYGHIVSGDRGASVWTVYCGFAGYYPSATTSDYIVTWDFEGSGYLWMPPLMADPTAVDKVYVGGGGSSGGAHLWRLHAHTFYISSEEEPFDFSEGDADVKISAMAFSPIDPHYRYVLTNDGRFFLSTDAGISWERTPAFEGPHSHYFYGSTIVASPITPGRVYIGGSGYSNPPVYVSDDHGRTFTAMDDGLPNTLVYELSITPEEDMLLAATEVGPFVYIFDSGRWHDMSGVSAPDQVYWTVDYVPPIRTARFATYGRGIWDFKIDSLTGIGEDFYAAKIPAKIKLSAHPNPFNTSVTISFDLPENTPGQIKIYDSSGRLVARLFDGVLTKGLNSFVWDGASSGGYKVPSGNYLAMLNAGGQNAHIKIVLAK